MKYLFLDTETTGKNEADRLVQLAYYAKDTGFVNELFKPPLPITYGAMGVHHITNDMVRGKPSFRESATYQDLAALLDSGHLIVAHNARFDVDMLRREGLPIDTYVDTLKLAKKYVENTDSFSLQALRYRLGLKPTLLAQSDVVAHDALGDVAILYELSRWLFRTIKQEHQLDNDGVAAIFIKSCEPEVLDIVTFGKHKGEKWEDVARGHRDYLEWLWAEKQQEPGPKDPDLLCTLKHYLEGYAKARAELMKAT